MSIFEPFFFGIKCKNVTGDQWCDQWRDFVECQLGCVSWWVMACLRHGAARHVIEGAEIRYNICQSLMTIWKVEMHRYSRPWSASYSNVICPPKRIRMWYIVSCGIIGCEYKISGCRNATGSYEQPWHCCMKIEARTWKQHLWNATSA